MKILCTGSSSYIGEVLTPMLEDKGHDVFCYDQKFGFDVCNPYKIKSCVEWCDAIVHLAACSTPSMCEANPHMAKRVNVDAVEEINRLRGDKPIFFPNTNIGYGSKTKQEIYDERSPMDPQSVYGKTKCEGEQLILKHGNCVVFRLASLFGHSPSMRWNLLLNFMVKEAFEKSMLELYEPDVRRNFLHVKDICRAFIHAIDHYDEMKDQVYNVGLSNHPTKKLLSLVIQDFLPKTKTKEIVGGDPDKRDYVISNEKIFNTGWFPKFSIEDGIEELIKVLRG